MSGPVAKPAAASKGSLWYSFRTVGWAFLGIRKRSASEEDLARVSPLHVVTVAIGAVVVLVIVLISFIKWVVLK